LFHRFAAPFRAIYFRRYAVRLFVRTAPPSFPSWDAALAWVWMRNLHAGMGIPIDKIEYRRGEMEWAFRATNVPAPRFHLRGSCS